MNFLLRTDYWQNTEKDSICTTVMFGEFMHLARKQEKTPQRPLHHQVPSRTAQTLNTFSHIAML